MHIYLFTVLVMHGSLGTQPPGTEAQAPLPQLEPGWSGGVSGHCWGALGGRTGVQTSKPSPGTTLVSMFLSCQSLSLLCCRRGVYMSS